MESLTASTQKTREILEAYAEEWKRRRQRSFDQMMTITKPRKETLFKAGDKVRIYQERLHRDKLDGVWSADVWTVDSVTGATAIVSLNGQTAHHHLYNLELVAEPVANSVGEEHAGLPRKTPDVAVPVTVLPGAGEAPGRRMSVRLKSEREREDEKTDKRSVKARLNSVTVTSSRGTLLWI